MLFRSHGAVVVEDAAQGIGGSWRGRALGAHGALSVLSFGRGKGNTSGGGGALLVHDERYAGQLPEVPAGGAGLVAVAKTGVQYLLARPGLYAIPASLPFLGLGETHYHPPHPAAGMGASGFGVLSRSVLEVGWSTEARRAAAAAYREALGPAARPAAPEPGRGEGGYLRFPLVLAKPDSLPPAAAELGILPGYPTALADLPGFGTKVASTGEVPGARLLARQLVTLPTQRQVRPDDRQRIIACVRPLSGDPPSR